VLQQPPSGRIGAPRPRRPATASGRRLLLVEDHPDTAEAMSQVLRMWGHQVVLAPSVAEAVEAAKRATRTGDGFDLVVCDIGLPDGTGWDLMRLLANRFHLRGIAVTAFSTAADRVRSAEAGFLAHLEKPVDLAQLSESIAAAASESGTPPANGPGAGEIS
jgi:CheY-like chemotaxis protein